MKFTVSNLSSSVFFLLIFYAFVSPIHGSNRHAALFIFGDSFLDAGNNNYINTLQLFYQSNVLPYGGETYIHFPNSGDSLMGRLYRFIDFIARRPEYAKLAMGIYKRGARKFVLMNLPPLGCLPGTRIIDVEENGKCLQELSNLASLHNRVLHLLLLQLQNKLKGFRFALYDFHTDVTQMMNHPFKYGLEDGKSACCGSGRLRGEYSCGGKRGQKEYELCKKPNTYLFWDSYHLTESAYKSIADRMWGFSNTSYNIGPYTIRHFFQLP
ncbi:LOW QUALITY PROTEIN: GDSL esterase/lipase 5-like [Vigna umbellata]|uniref:LOW QUALITY PROTEIN: GDSL esterase/lipase 5-like n=1 Tax=Vigna umbellata TaxID=87088 RepID=UPI001F5F26F2|nr:LOW QUALITY PROTEIN: GDSL esterase/lipase 5-like [Vigna umbellata]